MRRVRKKITGLLGLAFVVGAMAVAAGVPPVGKALAASNDVNISFKVVDGRFMAQILTPADASISYSDGGVSAKISYSNAQSVGVFLTFPDGRQELVDTMIPDHDSGEFEVALPVDGYGGYTITVSGKDLTGSAMDGDAKAFSYRAVTAGVNEDGDKLEVTYGSNVCRLGFQVYRADDMAKENPLLDPEYMMDVAQTGDTPNLLEVEIPGFEKLGPDEFTVVVTAYDCLNDDAIDAEDIRMTGAVLPPATGAVSILGVTVSQTDYLITGFAVFVSAAIFALFLLGRRRKYRIKN